MTTEISNIDGPRVIRGAALYAVCVAVSLAAVALAFGALALVRAAGGSNSPRCSASWNDQTGALIFGPGTQGHVGSWASPGSGLDVVTGRIVWVGESSTWHTVDYFQRAQCAAFWTVSGSSSR